MAVHDLLQHFIEDLHASHDNAQEFADASAGVVGKPEFFSAGDNAVG